MGKACLPAAKPTVNPSAVGLTVATHFPMRGGLGAEILAQLERARVSKLPAWLAQTSGGAEHSSAAARRRKTALEGGHLQR